MKRAICLILLLSMMMSGCSISGEWVKEPVTFYYVCKNYQKDMDTVIASEVREASGHRNDIPYLLALYTMGPSDDDLQSPLPGNTRILLTERTSNSITLSFSEGASTMTDADFTLASACVALTCMELLEISQVTVVYGEKNTTIRQDNLMLHTMAEKPQEETK